MTNLDPMHAGAPETSTHTVSRAGRGEANRSALIDVARGLEGLLLDAEEVIESERRMPAAVTDALYEGGIYRAFLPAELGGLDVHALEWLEAVEEVSRINGSAGWLCMLHTGSTWATPEAMRPILASGRWITAGNIGRAAGVAVRDAGGYRISGRWPFCSGSPEATYLYGLSVLYEHGKPVMHPVDGLPYFLQAYVPASEVILHDTWDGLGLRGTGSGDIEFDDVFVPSEMVNETGIWSHHYESPLLRANFNLAAHSAHAIGLAVAMSQEYIAIAAHKTRRGSFRQARMGREQGHQVTIAFADAAIRSCRHLLHDVISRAYDDAIHHTHIDYQLRVLMHEVNVYVVQTCRDALERMYRELGSAGVFRGLRVERIFRDMITASQHVVVSERSLDLAGQYWLTEGSETGPYLDLESGGAIRGPHPQFAERAAPPRAADSIITAALEGTTGH